MTTALTLDRPATAKLLKALADETRLRVVELLCDGERCVCEIQADVPVTQPLLSFHLKVLREAGLVSCRRDGRWAHYALRPDALALLRDTMDAAHACAVTAAGTACCD